MRRRSFCENSVRNIRARLRFVAFCVILLQRRKIVVDCIIIGSGIAGISAALTLQANAKTVEIFGSAGLSEKIRKAERIHNYPGLTDVSGETFVAALQTQLQAANISIKEEKVSGVYALNGKFGVATQEGGYYESACVILCCGVEAIKEIVGEREFLGRGVSYCATCDGFLYKDKTIAVVCTSKKMEHEISLLAGFAKQVYAICMYKDVEITEQNVCILRRMPQKITGAQRVEKLIFSIKPAEDIPTELAVDGVFVLRESISPAVLIADLEMQDGHVAVDRHMQTNVQGCFAAGDCTGKPYQYAKAAGEGNVAAHSVTAYLNQKKKTE